jgi:phenylalanyl-tRNA synthetase alpha chain
LKSGLTSPLHPLERRVLSLLKGRGWLDLDELVELGKESGLLRDQARRAISWLSSKGLISVKEESKENIDTSYTKPPEIALIERLESHNGRVPLARLKSDFGSEEEFSAALGRANRNNWIAIRQDQTEKLAELKVKPAETELHMFLELVAGGLDLASIPPSSRPLYEDLLKRRLISIRRSKSTRIAITEEGVRALETPEVEGYTQKLTPELIASIRSSGRSVELRPIDVEAPAPRCFPGRRHPVKEFINEVREVYLSMGFEEIRGDTIQSSFWNFDVLFTPQDHPARDIQDTFYIKGGRVGDLSRKGFVAEVASAHEDGWKTGSKGWGYAWDVEAARRLVLRTHNTPLTMRAVREAAGKDVRVFSVGRVYRNENLDFKHLAELHQMEGVVSGDGLNLRNLMGVLTEFYGKLGMSGVKLWPSYFPYTEPSMQVMVYYDKVGKWLEMGGSGIFRPEVTWPLGTRKPVLGWGCGLERLLMLRLGVDDIRVLYNNDLDWLRERREIASTEDHF